LSIVEETISPVALRPSIINTNNGVPTAVIMTLSHRPTGEYPSCTCGPYAPGYIGLCAEYGLDIPVVGYAQAVTIRRGTIAPSRFMAASELTIRVWGWRSRDGSLKKREER
jgi:hypothetical protein